MEAVTVDTNVLPVSDLEELAAKAGYALEIVSVTKRELAGTDLIDGAELLRTTPETMLWGETAWGEGVLGEVQDADDFERILRIISSGSFPKDRTLLTDAQRNQMRDASILQAHVRSGKRIFISNDQRGFVKHGRREQLEQLYNVKILTGAEFSEHCREILSAS